MLVRELGGREIQHTCNQAFVYERLHRLSAVAGGVEDEHLTAGALEPLFGALHARGRHAEHRRGDKRPVIQLRRRCGMRHEAGHRPRRLREHLPAHAVEPENVDDRVEHEDVFVADELPHRAGRERAQHDLGYAERQRSHRRGGYGRSR